VPDAFSSPATVPDLCSCRLRSHTVVPPLRFIRNSIPFMVDPDGIPWTDDMLDIRSQSDATAILQVALTAFSVKALLGFVQAVLDVQSALTAVAKFNQPVSAILLSRCYCC